MRATPRPSPGIAILVMSAIVFMFTLAYEPLRLRDKRAEVVALRARHDVLVLRLTNEGRRHMELEQELFRVVDLTEAVERERESIRAALPAPGVDLEEARAERDLAAACRDAISLMSVEGPGGAPD